MLIKQKVSVENKDIVSEKTELRNNRQKLTYAEIVKKEGDCAKEQHLVHNHKLIAVDEGITNCEMIDSNDGKNDMSIK